MEPRKNQAPTRKSDVAKESRSTVRSLRPGTGIRSAGNSPATSPVISKQVLTNKTKTRAKNAKPASPTVSPNVSLVDIINTPEQLSTPPAHGILTPETSALLPCPCGVRGRNVYKVDCSRCKREWHQDCLSLGGLNGSEIAKMVNYLCPFCYVPPVPNPDPSPNICFTCKNTDTVIRIRSQVN
jgi:hypothetical protein